MGSYSWPHPYLLITVSQLRLRIRMWCSPYLTYIAIAGMLGIVVAMAFIPDQRQPLMLGVVSLIVLVIAFGVRYVYGNPPDFAPTQDKVFT